MNKTLSLTMEWINQRSQRERVSLFILVLVIIYFFWSLFIIRPLQAQKNQAVTQLQSIKKQTEEVQTKINEIQAVVTGKEFVNAMEAHKQLSSASSVLTNKLASVPSTFTSPSLLPQLTEDIIQQTGNQIDILNMKTLPGEPWPPINVDKAAISSQNIYQYKVQIEFSGDYFAVLDYVARLEKLPWRLYWDQINYKVTSYPQALVSVQFHILSDQK